MIKQWIENLKAIWKIPARINDLTANVNETLITFEERLNIHTMIHTDIHTKQPTQVIVVGYYRGKDYVRCFDVPAESLDELVAILKELEPRARVGRMDMPGHAIPFSAVYRKDRF